MEGAKLEISDTSFAHLVASALNVVCFYVQFVEWSFLKKFTSGIHIAQLDVRYSNQ